MSLRTFFRPTASTVTVTILLTVVSTIIIYLTILSALDGGVALVPLWSMYIMVGLVLPLIASFRFLGSTDVALATIFGIALSGVWTFFLVCVVRSIILRFRK